MTTAVSQVLTECPDALVVLAKGESFITLTVDEAAQRATELAADYRLVGAVGTLDGNVSAVSEPGCSEVVGRALASVLVGITKRTEGMDWLENIHALPDPR